MAGRRMSILERAIKRQWIYPLPKTPLLVFADPATRLISALRTVLIERVAKAHDFAEWIFPRMVPEEVLGRTGWLNHHREEAWLLSQKREFVYKPADATNDLFQLSTQFPVALLPYALDPVQCVCFYYALYGKTIESERLPLRVYEYQGGWTHRHEVSADGLARGIAFLRLELVWLGTKLHAEQLRNALLRDAVETVVDEFGLTVHVAPGDSCFEQAPNGAYAAESIRRAEESAALANEPSIDLLVGDAESPSSLLEIASAGRHKELPKRFRIRIHDKGKGIVAPWSGCLGLGLTRLVLAFLSQHGFKPVDWPARVRREFGHE